MVTRFRCRKMFIVTACQLLPHIILLTISDTVASAEKSFSKLKLIKNGLSTTGMSETRRVDLAGERHFRIFPSIYSWLPVQNPHGCFMY
jgi:hypothetical protein